MTSHIKKAKRLTAFISVCISFFMMRKDAAHHCGRCLQVATTIFFTKVMGRSLEVWSSGFLEGSGGFEVWFWWTNLGLKDFEVI